jgi:hypothetical protein
MRRVLSRVIASRMRKPLHRIRSVSVPKASAVCGPGLSAVFPVRIRYIDDFVEFLAREIVGARLIHGNSAQAIRRVLSNPSGTNAEPEEAGEAFLLLLLLLLGGGGSRTFHPHLDSVTY